MRTFDIRPGSMGVIRRIPTFLVLGLLLPVSQSVYHTIEPVDSAPSVISSSTHAPDSTPVVVYSTSNLVVIDSKQRQKISYRHGFQILTEHSTAQVSQRRSHLQKRQTPGAAWSTDVTPYADRQAAATGTPLKNMGGLEVWSFFGELIRKSLQAAFGDFSFMNNLDVTKFATGQGLPIFAFVSVLILIILGTLMAIPFSCCCLFGGCCLRGKVAYQPWKRTSTAVCIVIFSILLIIGGITNISGSAQLTLGIRTTWGSANGLVDDARSLINSLDPTVQQILKLAESTVNGTIDNFATVDVPLLKTRVGGQVTTMVESLQAIQTDLGSVKQSGTTLQSTLDDLTTQVGTLETQLNAALTSVQGLNDHLTETTNGIGYELIQDITGIPAAQTIDVSGLPNITQLLEPLDTVPDLDETATTLTNQFDGLDAYVNDLATSQTSTIKDQIKVQIDSAGVTVSDMITQQVSTVSSQIDGFEQDAGVYVGYVSTYDGYRHLGMICLSGLVFAIMLAVGGGIVTKSKRVVCCCGVTVVPLISLIALIGLVYFAADLAVGTVCTQYNDRLAHISVSALSPDMVTMIQGTFDVIDKCYSGNVTLLDVGQEFGMDINVTAMLVSQLASFDISSFAGQVNLSSAVQLDQYDVGSLTSSFMDISVNLTVFDEISTSDLRTSMGDLSAALQDLDTNLDSNMFLYDSPHSPPSPGDRDAVVSDFRGRIAAALVLIAQVNTTEATVSGTLATIRSEAAEMVGFIDAAKGEGANAATAFDAFSTGVDTFLDETQTNFTTVKADQVLADINGLAVKVDETLKSFAQCVVLSSDVKAALNYLCISTLGGLDALWFSLVFMSIFLICMSITTCCAACRLADPAAYDGDAADEYGDKSKQRYKPTKPTIAKSFSMDGIKKSSPMTPGETITTSREEVDRMLRQQDEEKAERKKKLEEENESDGIVTLRRDGSKASSIRQDPTVGDPQQRDPPFRNSMTGRRRASVTQTSVLNRGPSLIQTPTAGSPSSSKIERSDYLALAAQTGTLPIYSPSGTLTNQKPKALTPKSMTLTGAAPSSNQQNISTLDDIEAEMARLAQDTGSESEKEKQSTLQPNRTRASTFGNGDRNADGIPTTIFEANSVPIISVNDPAQLDQINAQLEGRRDESVKGKQNPLEETSSDSRLSISIPPYSPSDTSPLSASEHAESPLLSQPPLPSFPPPSAPEKFQ